MEDAGTPRTPAAPILQMDNIHRAGKSGGSSLFPRPLNQGSFAGSRACCTCLQTDGLHPHIRRTDMCQCIAAEQSSPVPGLGAVTDDEPRGIGRRMRPAAGGEAPRSTDGQWIARNGPGHPKVFERVQGSPAGVRGVPAKSCLPTPPAPGGGVGVGACLYPQINRFSEQSLKVIGLRKGAGAPLPQEGGERLPIDRRCDRKKAYPTPFPDRI